MEVVAFEKFNNLKLSTITMVQINYHLSNERYQDTRNTATHLNNILQLLITKGSIASFFTTMWDHIYGCAKHYHCASDV